MEYKNQSQVDFNKKLLWIANRKTANKMDKEIQKALKKIPTNDALCVSGEIDVKRPDGAFLSMETWEPVPLKNMVNTVSFYLSELSDEEFEGSNDSGLVYMKRQTLTEEQSKVVADEADRIYQMMVEEAREAQRNGDTEKANETLWYGKTRDKLNAITRFQDHPSAYLAFSVLEEGGYSDDFTRLMTEVYERETLEDLI